MRCRGGAPYVVVAWSGVGGARKALGRHFFTLSLPARSSKRDRPNERTQRAESERGSLTSREMNHTLFWSARRTRVHTCARNREGRRREKGGSGEESCGRKAARLTVKFAAAARFSQPKAVATAASMIARAPRCTFSREVEVHRQNASGASLGCRSDPLAMCVEGEPRPTRDDFPRVFRNMREAVFVETISFWRRGGSALWIPRSVTCYSFPCGGWYRDKRGNISRK